jgi:integrase
VSAYERAGLPGLRFHDLRSLAASVLVASGINVKTAMTRLGHASARTTLELYARAHDDADVEAAQSVGAWFRSSASANG